MQTKLNTWFSTWNQILQKGYQLEKVPVECGILASAAAELLENEGKPWELKILHHADWQKGLKPKPYPELEWSGHVICLSGETVYDPILPTPMQLVNYLKELFPEQETITRHLENRLLPKNPYLKKRKRVELEPNL